LSAGRLWDAGKNAALLARVAPQLSWPVLLAGDPGDSAADLVADNCRPLGPLTRAELADVMGRAAIYALPARYEPFGLSVLEAAASGCALVLGRVPSLVEHWAGAASFVDPHDPLELQHTLESLTVDRQRCEQWGRQALARSQAFSAERMGAAYEQLYRELAQLRGGVPCAS
jgi:glycosyltransferase involved in cell wall biosynthesis